MRGRCFFVEERVAPAQFLRLCELLPKAAATDEVEECHEGGGWEKFPILELCFTRE